MEKVWDEKNGIDFLLCIVTEEESEMLESIIEFKKNLRENYLIPSVNILLFFNILLKEKEFLCVVGTDNKFANCYFNSKNEVY